MANWTIKYCKDNSAKAKQYRKAALINLGLSLIVGLLIACFVTDFGFSLATTIAITAFVVGIAIETLARITGVYFVQFNIFRFLKKKNRPLMVWVSKKSFRGFGKAIPSYLAIAAICYFLSLLLN